MISHRLDTFTFIGPTGFAVEGLCACSHKISLPPIWEHKHAIQVLQNAHDEHIVQVLERVWLGEVVR